MPILCLPGWQFHPDARLEQCWLRTFLGTDAVLGIAGVALDSLRHGKAKQPYQRMGVVQGTKKLSLDLAPLASGDITLELHQVQPNRMSILSKLQQDAVGDLALLEEPEAILFTQIEAQQLVITR